jgi:spore germination protein YaaH
MKQAADEVATAKVGSLQPFVAQPRSAAVGGSGGPQREVFGFALASSLSDPTVGYPSWNFSLLTTVAVFGLHVGDDGNFVSDSGMAVWNSSQLSSLVTKAHAAGTRVVLTIILQDFGAGTPHMCAGLAMRATTISQTVNQVIAKSVDGVNVDYEGLNGSCPNGQTPRAMMTDLALKLKAALNTSVPAASYLSVDTYASSAGDPTGFFDIPGMNAGTDAFFVMAYDSDQSNMGHPPLTGCPQAYCLSPVSPLSGYFYNDTRAASEYSVAVPASKVILGLPYYSRGACVDSWTPNQPPHGVPNPTPPPQYRYPSYTLTYRAAAAMATDPTNTSYVLHRDANDAAGMTAWSTWWSTNTSCPPQELYWDDVTSLGQKYDLVNRANLRGVGIWNLNFGGGAPELWATISTYFSCPVTLTVPTSPTSTEFTVGVDAGGCSVKYFDVEQFDSTLSQGWYPLGPVTSQGSTGTAVVDGYPGYTYRFRVRAHSTSGVVGAWATATVAVAAGAASPRPFKGLYVLDGYGGIHAASSPPLSDSSYWSGWSIARTAKALPGRADTGFVLDGFGGLHAYGAPGPNETSGAAGHYWAGWDIARDFAFLPDGSGGFVLDGYGGLHPFRVNGSTAPLQAQGFTYWQGWDIARRVVIFADGSGGYVLDGWGGLHPFGINGPTPPNTGAISGGGYWPGWDIARDVALVPGNGSHSGYVVDGFGGVHPFHPADGNAMPAPIQSPYWGWDIARKIWFLPGSSTAGYVLDGYGGLHPFGSAPAIASFTYWPGWDIARAVTGA